MHSHQKASGIHVGVAVVSVIVAMGLTLAQSVGVFQGTSELLFAVVLGCLFFPVVFIDPFHGILAYAVIAPLSPEADVGGISLRVQDPLAAVILMGTFFRHLRVGLTNLPFPLLRIILVYVLWGLITTVIGFVSPAFPNQEPDIRYTLKVFQFVVLTICVASSIRNQRQIWMLMGAMLLGLALQQFQFGTSIVERGTSGRFAGREISEQSNVLSVYICLSIAVAMGVMDRVKSIGIAIFLFFLVCFASAGFFNSLSRTGYASMAVIIVVGLVVMRRKIFPLFMLIGATAVVVTSVYVRNRLFTLGTVVGLVEDSSYESRLTAYDTIWTYVNASISGRFLGGGRGIQSLSFADTQWGIELLYGGYIGFAIMAVLSIMVFAFCAKLWLRCRRRKDGLGAASTACILAMSAAVMSEFGLTSWSAIRTGESIFILIGLAIATQRVLWIEEGYNPNKASVVRLSSQYNATPGRKTGLFSTGS